MTNILLLVDDTVSFVVVDRATAALGVVLLAVLAIGVAILSEDVMIASVYQLLAYYLVQMIRCDCDDAQN